jgi:hypothetical protein
MICGCALSGCRAVARSNREASRRRRRRSSRAGSGRLRPCDCPETPCQRRRGRWLCAPGSAAAPAAWRRPPAMPLDESLGDSVEVHRIYARRIHGQRWLCSCRCPPHLVRRRYSNRWKGMASRFIRCGIHRWRSRLPKQILATAILRPHLPQCPLPGSGRQIPSDADGQGFLGYPGARCN